MSKSLKESTSQTPTLNALDSLADALRFYAAPKNWGPVADYSDGYWYMSGRPWMRAYAALKDAGVDVSLLAEPEQEAPERAGEELADALVAAADFAQAMKAERDEAIRALSEGKREANDLLDMATHALRSYQCGNDAPDLAQSVADKIEAFRSPK